MNVSLYWPFFAYDVISDRGHWKLDTPFLYYELLITFDFVKRHTQMWMHVCGYYGTIATYAWIVNLDHYRYAICKSMEKASWAKQRSGTQNF